MTQLFMSHKINNALSEGQSIKSARTQTVARLLALSFSDKKKTESENFKNMHCELPGELRIEKILIFSRVFRTNC